MFTPRKVPADFAEHFPPGISVRPSLSPNFLTASNMTNVLVQASPLLILATGQTFALLMGGLDLSQGSIVSLVSVVTAAVMMDYGFAAGSIAGLTAGVGIGVLSGLLMPASNPSSSRSACCTLPLVPP